MAIIAGVVGLVDLMKMPPASMAFMMIIEHLYRHHFGFVYFLVDVTKGHVGYSQNLDIILGR